MTFAYLDESGDNGSLRGSSKVVALTLLLIKDKSSIDSLAKTIHKLHQLLRLTKKGRNYLNKSGGEIKFSNFPDKNVLMQTLSEIAQVKFHILALIINKKSKKITNTEKERIVHTLFGYALFKFANKNEKMKNWFQNQIELNVNETYDLAQELLDFIRSQDLKRVVADLGFFDKSENRYYCIHKSKDEGIEIIPSSHVTIKLPITYERISEEKFNANRGNAEMLMLVFEQNSSSNNKMLQITDLISGAIFQKYENADSRFYDLIEKNMKTIREINIEEN